MPINYELAKQEGPKLKAALTRAQKKDYNAVLAACHNALHDKNVSSIDGRIRPRNQVIAAPASSQKISPAVQALINKHAGGQ